MRTKSAVLKKRSGSRLTWHEHVTHVLEVLCDIRDILHENAARDAVNVTKATINVIENEDAFKP